MTITRFEKNFICLQMGLSYDSYKRDPCYVLRAMVSKKQLTDMWLKPFWTKSTAIQWMRKSKMRHFLLYRSSQRKLRMWLYLRNASLQMVFSHQSAVYKFLVTNCKHPHTLERFEITRRMYHFFTFFWGSASETYYSRQNNLCLFTPTYLER